MMKIKITILDRIIRKKFIYAISSVGSILSIILIFGEIENKMKKYYGVIGFVLLLVIYFSIWIYENKRKDIKIKINGSCLRVKVGDIFEEKGYKVIGVNEYFDTIVDDRIISKGSIHGQYINKYYENATDLDNRIQEDEHLNDRKTKINSLRKKGKKQKYRLGSIYIDDEFMLTAFTKFDENNRANLYLNEYIEFLLNFWNEVDILYSGKSVSIPLFGSGITRFKDYNNISDQELLELLIWSFKLSRIKFKYPAEATIVIYGDNVDKINFTKLKEWE